jgi:hypothetical protein
MYKMPKIINVLIFIFMDLMPFGNLSEWQNQEDVKKITTFLTSEYGEKADIPRKFIYDKVDLNGDGESEYLIGLMGPDFCGTGGCTMLVLNNEFKAIAKMTLVEYPVYIGSDLPEEKTNGYHNIYLRTRKVGFVKIEWNGKTYPSNPSMQPKISETNVIDKKKLLNAFDDQAWEF